MKPYKMIDRDYPITVNEMAQYCPAIFATEPHESRSEKYCPIDTIDVVDALHRRGFKAYMIGQSLSRDPTMYHTAKHMIRFRRGQTTEETMNEIILINSFNGRSSATLLGGVFRAVCMNGLIAGNVIQEIHIQHRGKGHINDYIDGAFTIVSQFKKLDYQREDMSKINLTYDQAYEFAEKALKLRWSDTDATRLQPDHLLWSRRAADNKTDLFTVFNRVQENLIKPRVTIITEAGKKHTPKKIESIDALKRINQSLWNLAEETMEAA